MDTQSATPWRRFRIAASGGWRSAKANLVPGLVIVALAALIVVSYYQIPAVSDSLEGLVEFRRRLGVWFAMAASAIGAGIIPGVYLMLAGRARQGLRGVLDLLFGCLVWAAVAFSLDRFYLFQSWLWGPTVSIGVLLGKVMIDQLVFSPLVGVQIPGIGFRFRDLDYRPRALWKEIRGDWIFGVTVPLLVACWLTWLPGSLVIYALPLPLQIPMMALIQCFFALEVAYTSSRLQEK